MAALETAGHSSGAAGAPLGLCRWRVTRMLLRSCRTAHTASLERRWATGRASGALTPATGTHHNMRGQTRAERLDGGRGVHMRQALHAVVGAGGQHLAGDARATLSLRKWGRGELGLFHAALEDRPRG